MAKIIMNEKPKSFTCIQHNRHKIGVMRVMRTIVTRMYTNAKFSIHILSRSYIIISIWIEIDVWKENQSSQPVFIVVVNSTSEAFFAEISIWTFYMCYNDHSYVQPVTRYMYCIDMIAYITSIICD